MEPDSHLTYAEPGPMTVLGHHTDLLAGLPDDPGELRRIVQGVMLHVFWASAYGVTDDQLAPRRGELEIRCASHMLDRIRELDDRPLTAAREPLRKLVGNCRDFSVLLTALLRHKGIPARARCGFGRYFTPGKHEDHWVTEVWRADEGRWTLADAQLDEVQVDTLQVTFDPLDVPRDEFVTGPLAWLQCRAGEADPATFGIGDMWGLWFVRGNVVRDIAALNKMELLPWDCWGVIDEDGADDNAEALALLDHAARLAAMGDASLDELQALYASEPRLRVPPSVTSYGDGTPRPVALSEHIVT